MPMLNAAVLEDMKRLLLALKMGVDKLERWVEFRRLAVSDAMKVADVDRPVVSEALEQMAATMEQQPKYFDPELPGTFRFLSEAVRDPIGATKTVVFGAVKSAENLIKFLGTRALGIVTKAFDTVESHISKVVAISLISGFSLAAAQLSGALPATWAWLKPLLEAIAKAGP